MEESSGKGGIQVRAQAADCMKFNLPWSIETGQDARTAPQVHRSLCARTANQLQVRTLRTALPDAGALQTRYKAEGAQAAIPGAGSTA